MYTCGNNEIPVAFSRQICHLYMRTHTHMHVHTRTRTHTHTHTHTQVQRDIADLLSPHFSSDGLVVRSLQYADSLDHVMDFTRLRAVGSLFSMLNQLVRNVLNYNQSHSDFPLLVGGAHSVLLLFICLHCVNQ